jgi:hypothetical protein
LGHPPTGGWFKNTSAWLALDWRRLAQRLGDEFPSVRLADFSIKVAGIIPQGML